MDAVKSLFIWPLYQLVYSGLFILAVIINFPAIFLRIRTHGAKSISGVRGLYQFSKALPLGKFLVSGIVSMFAPYSATVGAQLEDLTDNSCTWVIHDYPWLRNPFQSIHALALGNVGEMASGTVMLAHLEKNKHLRGIPVKITCEYLKKARGKISARATLDLKVSVRTPNHFV